MNFLKKKAVIHDNENGKKTELKYKNSSQNPENVDNININSKAKLNTVDNSIEYHHNQSHINNLIIGLPNSSAYCYLNSILQTLFSCQDFQDEIIEIYQESLNCVDQNKEFVISLGNLFHHMKERNKKEVENAVGRLYKHFDRTIYGDDIYKHYLQILKKINDEIKTPPESSEVYNKNSNSADEQFLVHKHKNNGFIFDLFCGQLSFKQKCDKCFNEFAGNFGLFKSIPLQIPSSSEKIPIIKCVESFFEESKIDGTSSECCNTGVFSFKEITHSPRFIFIYLLRRASNLPGSKNNTFIEFDNYINIPTEKVNVLYKLRSVIDHLSGNESGHYFVKTLLGSDWYLLNDVQVTKINPTYVPTKHSIGLLIEKVTNLDENIPEPLINYDEKSFYQNGFQSILEIFYQCCPIRQYFIDLYNINKDNKTKDFKETLGQLFNSMRNKDEKEVINGVENLIQIFENSIDKDDIHKCFLQTLNKIYEETKLPQENNYSESENKTNISADDQFLVYKNKNNGLIFDNLFGQTSYETKCNNRECNIVFIKDYELFSSIQLQLQSLKQNTPISECIEKHFANSKIEEANYQCCDKQEIISVCQISHSPQFIFIYLVRGNYNTFIEFNNYINIPTVNGNVLYKLRSVIDRCNYNTSGGYLVKMLIKANWWLRKDYRMKHVNPSDVPTNLSVGLLFEKVTNINHKIPESLLIDKYNSKYQNALLSIVKYLYLCCDIRKHLIDFYTNTNTSENITEDRIFKRKIGEIMILLEKTETADIQILLKETLNFLSTKIENIDKLYCCILDKLNDKTTNINEDTKQESAMSEPDLFGDQISIDLKCRLCEKIFYEGIKTFKSITIKEPTSNQEATIDECIERFLENSENNEFSDKQQIISTNQLTNSPQFIFIYIVRKFNNFIKFNNYINVATVNGNVLYKLRYVIDQIYANQSIYYVVKTLSDSNWLWKSDYEENEIKPINVPTKYSVGLLIEKVTNINHNVPETLLYCNYILGSLLSILQMLYLCSDIRICLINFYANNNLDENITENLIFKKKIGEVMYFLENENESGRINNLVAEASNFLPNKIIEIQELYLCVMNKLNEKETHINSNLEYYDSIDESGYKCSRMHCENCNKYLNEISRPQIFKSFYLKSENNKLNLSKRIENFCKSHLDANNDIEKCCNNPKLVIIDEILSAPKYLFICFDGIERNIENEEIILNTKSGGRQYVIQSLLNYSTVRNNGQTKKEFSVKKFDSNSFPKLKNLSVSIIAVMMVREEIKYEGCRTDKRTKELCNSKSDLHKNLNNQHEFDEEKLESYCIAESIKQIIELNKDNKIYVLLGLLFSCTQFRNFMINLNRNNEIKKVFEKFALIESGKFFENVCNLYDRVIKQKTISSFIKSDDNWTIHQCFNYIFISIKLITESKEFCEIFKSNNQINSNFINDTFYGTFLLEVICMKCSNRKKSEDSFRILCVKKPKKEVSIDLKNCFIDFEYEENYQIEEKCCENAELFLTRKIIHSPPILFLCSDEQTKNINEDCILPCDSILTIDTTVGPVTYSLLSLVDRYERSRYDVKFLGNSGWLKIFPSSRKISNSELFTKNSVGFLFKKLE